MTDRDIERDMRIVRDSVNADIINDDLSAMVKDIRSSISRSSRQALSDEELGLAAAGMRHNLSEEKEQSILDKINEMLENLQN